MSQKKSAVSLAAAAAALAVSSFAFAADRPEGATGPAVSANDKVNCYGINSCKGSADCKTAANSCKGQNGCKAKGFKSVTAKECLSKDGVISDLKG
jgi:uncharacterized membrane protein